MGRGESSRREFHLADTWWGCSPDWLGAARGCTVKEDDGFRVCSDGADKESAAVVEVWVLGKLLTGQMGMRAYAGLLRTPSV